MNLLTYLLQATQRWSRVFPQERSLQRALTLAFGILCGVGKRTLTRAICFHGNTQKDWRGPIPAASPEKPGSRCPNSSPPMNRWAIIGRPCRDSGWSMRQRIGTAA
jgi:hypothetical protein